MPGLLAVLCLQALHGQTDPPDVRANMTAQLRYIETYKTLAIGEMQRTGIPASITLAQAILETNGGQSLLAREANNHFGMKCNRLWKGKTFFKHDEETDEAGNPVESCFRLYTRPQESFADHSKFLKRPRYAFLWKLQPTDYHGWAEGLDTAGYSFAEGYGRKLVDIIDRYRLYVYDTQTTADFSGDANLLQRRLGWLNNAPVVLAEDGETPAGIARAYGLEPEAVLRFNDHGYQAAEALPDGAFIFLAEKSDQWQGRFVYHTVLEGETMFSIAQVYGISLADLRKRNQYKIGQQPAPGDRLQIREPLPEPPALAAADEPLPSGYDLLLTDAEAAQFLAADTATEEDIPTVELTQRIEELYTVQPGDTLFAIARRFDTSVPRLKALNHLTDNAVKAGQKIKTQ